MERQYEDMDKVVSLLRGVDKSLTPTAIEVHFRLEKYTKESKKPKPILVTSVRSEDVFCVLAKTRELKKLTFVKRDLSPLQRKHESILLNERWSLIQSGESHNSINIQNS